MPRILRSTDSLFKWMEKYGYTLDYLGDLKLENFIALVKERTTILLFKCANSHCNSQLRVYTGRVNIHTGFCTSCLKKKKPYGVIYNKILLNAKRKN